MEILGMLHFSSHNSASSSSRWHSTQILVLQQGWGGREGTDQVYLRGNTKPFGKQKKTVLLSLRALTRRIQRNHRDGHLSPFSQGFPRSLAQVSCVTAVLNGTNPDSCFTMQKGNLLVLCWGALAVFWCHIESADTRKREQESDTPVLKRTDRSCGARRQPFISFRWGKCN